MKLLTLARDLQRRKSRGRHGLFVAEGVRAVEELLRSPVEVRGALVSEAFGAGDRAGSLRAALERRSIEVLEVSERDFADAASTDTPQGILAIGVVPPRRLADVSLPSRARLLVLDAVQDPGNVGTLLRTAAALGAAATLALPGTVDLWNAKVVRSAMGALFHHPALSCTWDELDEFLRDREIPLWGATGDGEPAHGLTVPESLALAVGNEGAGLTAETLARTARRVTIPIEPDVESLNVAVAAGILLYQFRR